jgi:hypothetical protein
MRLYLEIQMHVVQSKTASCYEELRNCISGHVHRALCTVPQSQYTHVFAVLRKPQGINHSIFRDRTCGDRVT